MTIRFCLDGIKDISLLHPDVTPSEFDDGLIRILSFGHSDYFRTVISESAISNHLAVNANSSYFGMNGILFQELDSIISISPWTLSLKKLKLWRNDRCRCHCTFVDCKYRNRDCVD